MINDFKKDTSEKLNKLRKTRQGKEREGCEETIEQNDRDSEELLNRNSGNKKQIKAKSKTQWKASKNRQGQAEDRMLGLKVKLRQTLRKK